MNYRQTKRLIIIATVLVWIRLLIGTVQTLTNPTPYLDNPTVATTQIQ